MDFHAFVALLFLLMTSAAGLYYWNGHPWWSLLSFFYYQCGALLGGFLLSEIPSVQRFLMPKEKFESETAKNAFANFLALGLGHTRDRNGVLIHVSLLERKIHILADEGIHDKVGDAFWETQTTMLVESIRKGQAVAGLESAILQIGAKLEEHFPHQPGDKNQFGDKVREKSLV
jgi:uncharacterized membrane protein